MFALWKERAHRHPILQDSSTHHRSTRMLWHLFWPFTCSDELAGLAFVVDCSSSWNHFVCDCLHDGIEDLRVIFSSPNKALQPTATVPGSWQVDWSYSTVVAVASALPVAVAELGR